MFVHRFKLALLTAILFLFTSIDMWPATIYFKQTLIHNLQLILKLACNIIFSFFIEKGIADSLSELYFEMNPLTKLNSMMFAGLSSLQKLCIHSSITELPRDVLSELPR